jgi:exodeoxyribonuclease VII large subunit
MINNPSDNIFTVSELTRSLKTILENEYRFIRISGEISNLKTPFSGHSYFTLKDQSSQIRSVLFKQQKRFVDLRLEDGQEVLCFGRITVYEPRGDYQLIIDSVQLYGIGQLQIEFDKLKNKLSRLGYFDQSIKKSIPGIVNKIAVVSSPTGAAIKDFLKVFSSRNGSAHIQLLPVRVQGNNSSSEIQNAIQVANKVGDFDVIVLCRGGGSLEDLWSFNEECVGEAIFNSKIPVITGIGHEVDFTIADFCADLRCPTPTAAAEALVADHLTIRDQIKKLQKRIHLIILARLQNTDRRVQYQLKLLGNVDTKINDGDHRLNLSRAYLCQAIGNRLTYQETRLQNSISRLEALTPTAQLRVDTSKVNHLQKMLFTYMNRVLEIKEAGLSRNAALLNSVSPLATLARGYAIARREDRGEGSYKVLRRSVETTVGEDINVLLSEGELNCRVTEIKK